MTFTEKDKQPLPPGWTCTCDENKQLCVAHGLSVREQDQLAAQGHVFKSRKTSERLDHRAHADTAPQPKYASVDSAANAWKRRDEPLPNALFQIGDIVDWTPKGPLTRMLTDTYGTTIRGCVYLLSPLSIKTAERRCFDTSSYPSSVVLVTTTPRIGYLSARLEKDMNAAITAQHERAVSMLWGGQQVTVKADATVRPGTMRVDYTQPIGNAMAYLGPEYTPVAGDVVMIRPEMIYNQRLRGVRFAIEFDPSLGRVMANPLNAACGALDPKTCPQMWMRVAKATTDPLDVEYDGWTLRDLLSRDERRSREQVQRPSQMYVTPAQRSAISAHWSTELRKRVDATKQTEREQVVCERDEDGL